MPALRTPGSTPSGNANRVTVSLVGTLPPVKGVSAYTAQLLGAPVDQGDRCRMLLVRAVRKVQPGNAEARLHERAECLGVIGRRTEGTDDFRSRE